MSLRIKRKSQKSAKEDSINETYKILYSVVLKGSISETLCRKSSLGVELLVGYSKKDHKMFLDGLNLILQGLEVEEI